MPPRARSEIRATHVASLCLSSAPLIPKTPMEKPSRAVPGQQKCLSGEHGAWAGAAEVHREGMLRAELE